MSIRDLSGCDYVRHQWELAKEHPDEKLRREHMAAEAKRQTRLKALYAHRVVRCLCDEEL